MFSKNIKRDASAFFGIPEDVAFGIPEFVVFGNKRLVASGCGSLGGYSENEIKLFTGKIPVVVKGRNLVINSIENSEIIVSGKIISLEFL